jgi:hypothetical protein
MSLGAPHWLHLHVVRLLAQLAHECTPVQALLPESLLPVIQTPAANRDQLGESPINGELAIDRRCANLH